MSSNVLAWAARTLISTPLRLAGGAVASTAKTLTSHLPSGQKITETFYKKIWHQPTAELRAAAEQNLYRADRQASGALPLVSLTQAAERTQLLLTACTTPSSSEEWTSCQESAVQAWEELYNQIQGNLLPISERESEELRRQLENACGIADLPTDGVTLLARQTHLAHALRPLSRTLQTLASKHTDCRLAVLKREYINSSTPCPKEFRVLTSRIFELQRAIQEGDARRILHATRLNLALLTAILEQDVHRHPRDLAASYHVPVEFIEQLYPLQQYLLLVIRKRDFSSFDPTSENFCFSRTLGQPQPLLDSMDNTLRALVYFQQRDDDRQRPERALSRLVKGEKEESAILPEPLLQTIWKHYIDLLDREEKELFCRERSTHLEVLLRSPHALSNAPLTLARQNAHRVLNLPLATAQEIAKLLGTLEFLQMQQDGLDLPTTTPGLPARTFAWGSQKLLSLLPMTGTVRAIAEPLIKQGANHLTSSLTGATPSISTQIAPHVACPPEFRILSKYVNDLMRAFSLNNRENIRESTLQSWALLRAILIQSGAPDQNSVARFYGIPLPVVQQLMQLHNYLLQVLHRPDVGPLPQLLEITQKTLTLWQEAANLPQEPQRALLHALVGERPEELPLTLRAEYEKGYHHFQPEREPHQGALAMVTPTPTPPAPMPGFVGDLLQRGVAAISPSSGVIRGVMDNQATNLHGAIQRTLERVILPPDREAPPLPPSSGAPSPTLEPSRASTPPEEQGVTGKIYAALQQGLQFFERAKAMGIMQVPKMAIQGAASQLASALRSYAAGNGAAAEKLQPLLEALEAIQEEGGIDQISKAIRQALTYFLPSDDAPTISDPFFMDNLDSITHSLDFNVRQGNHAQPLEEMMTIEKNLFIKHTSHLTPLKFINEVFCRFPPPRFRILCRNDAPRTSCGPE